MQELERLIYQITSPYERLLKETLLKATMTNKEKETKEQFFEKSVFVNNSHIDDKNSSIASKANVRSADERDIDTIVESSKSELNKDIPTDIGINDADFQADMEAQDEAEFMAEDIHEPKIETIPSLTIQPKEIEPVTIPPDNSHQESENETPYGEYQDYKEAPEYPVDPNAKPTAVVIHCSDPRFNYAFRVFIENTLGLPSGNYIPLVFGGGAGVLAHPFELPKEAKFVKDRLEYWKTRFPSVKRIILINHEDCKYYNQLKEKLTNLFPNNALMDKVAKMDLLSVAKMLKAMSFLTGYSIEVYYAKFKDETHESAEFEQVV